MMWRVAMAAALCGGMGGSVWGGDARQAAGFAVVPFAVPVAVPVAVLQSPAVLYGYTRYAPQPAAAPPAVAVDAPPAGTAGTLLARHCGACHTGPAAAGGLALFERLDVLRARLPRQRVLEAVVAHEGQRARMPPEGRQPLSAAELDVLRQWAVPPAELEY